MVDDKILIWQFNRGRQEALHRIYERYKDRLVTLAAALLTDIGLAEDVVHDVFIGFIHAEGRFRLTGNLMGYLSTCVANAARNCNKAERRRRHAPLDEVVPPIARNGDPQLSAAFSEDSDRLVQALGQLPYEQREVLVLRAYSSMKFTAIAAQQNVSIHTVQGRYRYALDKLREILSEDRTQKPQVTQFLKLRQG
ncbi:MAG: sigma-70 family RNA polymerase sigma factor [Phycisphaerae bacterium]|nr:sigma-70 family RNA polymerase sigma factor [Phycisphaerae bacterium]